MRLNEMKQALADGSIQLTKSLGQNFLHDGNQLRRIIDAAELKPSDRVLEVGPGLGPLTELLLAEASEVLAIEKDARLVEFLRRRFALADSETPGAAGEQAPNPAVSAPAHRAVFQLYHDDALFYLKRERRDWSQWKLVSNLPYSVASTLLVELARADHGPERMVTTLQLEVSRRLMARPGDADYGVLTLLVGLDYESRDWFKIPAACFFPPPDVDSACICLARRAAPLLAPELRGLFARVVKRSFSQRRKMMLKLLKAEWPLEKLGPAFAALGISPQARAETVSLDQFVALTRFLHE